MSFSDVVERAIRKKHTNKFIGIAKLCALADHDDASKRPSALAPKGKEVLDTDDDDDEDDSLRERLIAEYVGTFFLVLTVAVAVCSGGLLAAVGIGCTLSVQIYTFGSVSGGLFNPAVTLAVLLAGRGKIKPLDAALYIGAQVMGAITGGFVAFGVTGESFCFDYRATPAGGWGSSVVLEIIFTMALCNTVLSTGTSFDAPNQYFGAAIGGTVTACAIACGPWNQGSFNPAVTVGINMANYLNQSAKLHPSAGAWTLFIWAPLAGGCLSAAVFHGTRSREYVKESVKLTEAVMIPILLHEKLLAELIGTLMLVLTVVCSVTGHAPLAPIAIGFMLTVQIFTFASVSGGLFNPAVTLSVFLSRRRKLAARDACLYTAAQLVAGILAGFIGYGVTTSSFVFGVAQSPKSLGWGTGFVLELLFTCLLCSNVLSAGTSSDAPNQYFGLAIGGAVIAGASACGGFDQGSFNPSVTLGINIANFANSRREAAAVGDWFLHLLAPLAGGSLATVIFRLTRANEYAALATEKPLKFEAP